MRGEIILTEADLATHFRGERDLITYEPYRVGDRIVRCGACRSIIKSEFVTNNRCPLCERTPFRPAQVNIPRQSTITPRHPRSLPLFLWLLVLSAVAAYIPFAIPEAAGFLYEVSFELGFEFTMICIGAISLIAAIILFFNRHCRKLWQTAKAGVLLAFVPASAPYLVLAAVWAVICSLAVLGALLIFALVVAIIASFFN